MLGPGPPAKELLALLSPSWNSSDDPSTVSGCLQESSSTLGPFLF